MTRAEAVAEAQKRWGPLAWVTKEGERFEVGYNRSQWGRGSQDIQVTHGSGDSWEAAFLDADSREAVSHRGAQ